MIVDPDGPPVVARELDAILCWMSEKPLRPRSRYVIKHTTRTVRALVDALEYRVDVNTVEHHCADHLALNDIGRDRLSCSAPLIVDRYEQNRTTGSFILIDEASNDTVAAGTILDAH